MHTSAWTGPEGARVTAVTYAVMVAIIAVLLAGTTTTSTTTGP